MYKVIIVEDEAAQQQQLIHHLGKFPFLEILATAGSVEEGERILQQERPDLVFMDVCLKEKTCFDLLNSLGRLTFDIIFTTSFEEYAVKAFRMSAIDYLVKPIDPDELTAAVEKFRNKKVLEDTRGHIQNLLSNVNSNQTNHKIALPTLTGYIFVPVSDIIRCESDNTYTTFFTKDKKKIVVSKTLKECGQILADYNFYRVHNCHLINIDYIVEYVKGEGGLVKMADGSHVDVSRRRKDDFLRQIKKD